MKKFNAGGRVLIAGIVVGIAGMAGQAQSNWQDRKQNGTETLSKELLYHGDVNSLAFRLAVNISNKNNPERIARAKKRYSPEDVLVYVKLDHDILKKDVDEFLAVLWDAPEERAEYDEMVAVLEAAIEAGNAFAASHGGDESSMDVEYWEEKIATVNTALLRCRKFDKSYYDAIVPPESFLKMLAEQRSKLSNAVPEEVQSTVATNTEPLHDKADAVYLVAQTNTDTVSNDSEASTLADLPSTSNGEPQPEKNKSFPKPLLALLGLGGLAVLGWYAARKR